MLLHADARLEIDRDNQFLVIRRREDLVVIGRSLAGKQVVAQFQHLVAGRDGIAPTLRIERRAGDHTPGGAFGQTPGFRSLPTCRKIGLGLPVFTDDEIPALLLGRAGLGALIGPVNGRVAVAQDHPAVTDHQFLISERTQKTDLGRTDLHLVGIEPDKPFVQVLQIFVELADPGVHSRPVGAEVALLGDVIGLIEKPVHRAGRYAVPRVFHQIGRAVVHQTRTAAGYIGIGIKHAVEVFDIQVQVTQGRISRSFAVASRRLYVEHIARRRRKTEDRKKSRRIFSDLVHIVRRFRMRDPHRR